jgi:putative SOS response-associated peptidase YedK
MCGRFTITDPRRVAACYGAAVIGELPARFNVAPSQEVAAVIAPGRIELLRWGLVPAWADDPSIGNRLVNARAESLERKPAFRDALRTRRCLILADGFYEWRRDGKVRRPFFVRLRGGTPFAFAGLWAERQGVRTCTIVTTEANALVAPIHDRMPAILRPEHEARWLDPSVRDPGDLVDALEPFPSHLMEAWEVSTRVNKPDHEEPANIEPVE